MSLFGAMSTAISGLGAQSAAFTNISDDLANSQTVGYKGVNTSFIDYLTTSSATQNDSGAVVARPDYTNSVQGTVTQSSDSLALAIAGQGFFNGERAERHRQRAADLQPAELLHPGRRFQPRTPTASS